MFRISAAVILGSILLCNAFAASLPTPAKKDPVALNYIQAALTAMGGSAAVAQVQDSVISGTITPTTGSWVQPASFIWKTSGSEFRTEISRSSGDQIFVSGHGKPAVSRNGTVANLYYHVSMVADPFQLPALVLASKLADPQVSIFSVGSTSLAGKAVFKVQTSSSRNAAQTAITQQIWYFDTSTGLPLRVEYRIPAAENMEQWTDAATDYSAYQQIEGLLVPFQMTYSEDGSPLETLSVSQVNFNVGSQPSEFDLQAGGGK